MWILNQTSALVNTILSKMPFGKFSSLPSGWIDIEYLYPAQSRFGKIVQFLKTRAIYATLFPICAALDVVAGFMMAVFHQFRLSNVVG